MNPHKVFNFCDGHNNIKIELYEPCGELSKYLFTLESDDDNLEKAHVVLDKHQMKFLLESVLKTME